jgi:hypothetical protein
MDKSPLKGEYDVAVDRESAYEILKGRVAATQAAQPSASGPARRTFGTGAGSVPRTQAPAPRASNRQTVGEAVLKSAARSVTSSIGSSLGRALVRGVLGSLLKR